MNKIRNYKLNKQNYRKHKMTMKVKTINRNKY